MGKYIDRDVLLKAVCKLKPDSADYECAHDNRTIEIEDVENNAYWAACDIYDEIIFAINNADVEDVQPAKVGYWRLRKLNETGNYDLECGNCGFRVVLDPYEMKYANFCNNCGMKNKRLIEERCDNSKDECK